MSESIQAIRGMHDILPGQSYAWQRLEGQAAAILQAYGYTEMRTPVVEKTALFQRAIGAATDVVEKEMYSFDSRSGDSLSLRPEGTAGVVRAVLQHAMLYAQPVRLWYQGPMFRHERPQRGRTRQFHQIGAEVFGLPGADIEVELLLICKRLWKSLNINGLKLEINTLGNLDERRQYRAALVDYLSQRKSELDADSLQRLEKNPLRILDSKNPALQDVIAQAPLLPDFLQTESAEHFARLRELLEAAGVSYHINPKLVRGLDYYSQTVFEWVTDQLGAQGTVCAGGRYDGLVEIQGGKPWPGVGFAMGQERLIELMQAAPPPALDVYLVVMGQAAETAGLVFAEQLRDQLPDISVLMNHGGGSFKAQFKRADKSGARFAAVLGEQEVADQTVTIKFLREDADQESLPQNKFANWLTERLEA